MLRTFKISLDEEKEKMLKWNFKLLYSFEPQNIIKLEKRN